MSDLFPDATPKAAHTFKRDEHDWYVEPRWCVDALLDAEPFPERVYDPACGMGTIPDALLARKMKVHATDLVDRGMGGDFDFLSDDALDRVATWGIRSIITNPPYKHTEAFIERALTVAEKVAVIVPLKFLASNARWHGFAHRWPLARIYVLSSRPSMLPGERLLAGDKPGGGAIDYCWLVFQRGWDRGCDVRWLVKPGAKARPHGVERKRTRAPEAPLQAGGKP